MTNFDVNGNVRVESVNNNSEEIKGSLNALVKKITNFDVNGNVRVDYTKKDNDLLNELTVDVVADVVSDGNLPQTIPQVLEFMAKIPQYLQKSNAGKGVQIEFDLYPVQELKYIFNQEFKIDRMLKSLDETFIFQLVNEFDNFTEQKLSLQDLIMEVTQFQNYFSKSSFATLKDTKNKADSFEISVKDKLKRTLISVRSGKEDTSKLVEITNSLRNEKSSIEEFIDNNNMINECNRIKDYKSNLGIEYFFGNSLHYQFSGYILFYTVVSDMNLMNENIDLLRLLQLIDKSNKFYFCNLDANEQFKKILKINEICFRKYQNGKCLENDLYSSKKEMLTWSLAKSESLKVCAEKPSNLDLLKVRCPNSGLNKCSRKSQEWKCVLCHKIIQVDLKNLNFYCECGFALRETFSFKCCAPQHPHEFITNAEIPEELKKVINLT